MKSDEEDNPLDPFTDIVCEIIEYNHALDLEETGNVEEAAEVYENMLYEDPDDHIGAGLHLAALGKVETPSCMPEAHVKTLFGKMSDGYDDKLLNGLNYAVPDKVREKIETLQFGPFKRMLDLGCGTGLCCEVFKDHATHKTGLDLSAEMLEKARQKEIYDDLYEGDIAQFLMQGNHEHWDLVVLTDVIPYIGALDEIFAGVARNMVAGGIFLFSTETQPETVADGQPYTVGKYWRYAHSQDYVRTLLNQNKFDLSDLTHIILRNEKGNPVPGSLVIARKL